VLGLVLVVIGAGSCFFETVKKKAKERDLGKRRGASSDRLHGPKEPARGEKDRAFPVHRFARTGWAGGGVLEGDSSGVEGEPGRRVGLRRYKGKERGWLD